MSLILSRDFSSVANDYLVVCEGHNDARFLEELLLHARIENCSIGCPHPSRHGSGVAALASYLKSLQGMIQLGAASLKGLMVVVDADGDAGHSFTMACEWLAAAEFPLPQQPFVVVAGTTMKTSVFVMPGAGRTGTLEDLIWLAAVQARPEITSCVEACLACASDVSTVSDNKLAKMRMSTLVGATCRNNPWASLNLMWKDPNNPIPIASEIFAELSSKLEKFVIE